MQKVKIIIKPDLYLLISLLCLLIPIKWIVCWLVSVVIHELFHYLAISFCKLRINCINVNLGGVLMCTEPMTVRQEFICSLAGPIGSLCLLLLVRCLPCLSICGFIQFIFNMMPILPLDGGRVIRCLMDQFLPSKAAYKFFLLFQRGFVFFLVIICLIVSVRYHLGLLPAGIPLIILFKNLHAKLSCKQKDITVQ